jgi:hypothetical protein
MSGVILPLLQYVFMAWCSVKAQGLIYIYLTLVSQPKGRTKTGGGVSENRVLRRIFGPKKEEVTG